MCEKDPDIQHRNLQAIANKPSHSAEAYLAHFSSMFYFKHFYDLDAWKGPEFKSALFKRTHEKEEFYFNVIFLILISSDFYILI